VHHELEVTVDPGIVEFPEPSLDDIRGVVSGAGIHLPVFVALQPVQLFRREFPVLHGGGVLHPRSQNLHPLLGPPLVLPLPLGEAIAPRRDGISRTLDDPSQGPKGNAFGRRRCRMDEEVRHVGEEGVRSMARSTCDMQECRRQAWLGQDMEVSGSRESVGRCRESRPDERGRYESGATRATTV